MPELVSCYVPDVVILQETKLERVDRDIVRSLCSFQCVDWISLPTVGRAGGILMLWNKDTVALKDNWVDRYSVSLDGVMSGETQQ